VLNGIPETRSNVRFKGVTPVFFIAIQDNIEVTKQNPIGINIYAR
jgi:hypothetical protein